MEQIKSGDFELSETVDNIISTRRPIKLSNSNETVTRRKIDFTDSWVHLRKSNTEPIIRIYSEAPTREQADKFAGAIIDEIKRIARI